MENTVFRKHAVNTSGTAWQPENQALVQKSVTLKECCSQVGSTHHSFILHARKAGCLSKQLCSLPQCFAGSCWCEQSISLVSGLWNGNTTIPLLPNGTHHRVTEGEGWKLHGIILWVAFQFMWLKRIIRVLVCHKHHWKIVAARLSDSDEMDKVDGNIQCESGTSKHSCYTGS